MTSTENTFDLSSFPLASHDSWQFHFYSSELRRFFSIRYWMSTSVKQAWCWTVDLEGHGKEVIAYIEKAQFGFDGSQTTSAVAVDSSSPTFSFTELSNITHEGALRVMSPENTELIRIDFAPNSTYFWHVPGQKDGVFHFPDIMATIHYQGRETSAVGYCKRYWGNYDGPWGYQFIQGSADDKSKFFWTADATFGDDEYHYFKVHDGESNSLIVEANKLDTWHNNQRAFWRPSNDHQKGMEVELTPVATMEFFLKSDRQYSKLVERFGPVQLRNRDGSIVFNGYGFNEICFGTVA
jgi:hypothetical protein